MALLQLVHQKADLQAHETGSKSSARNRPLRKTEHAANLEIQLPQHVQMWSELRPGDFFTEECDRRCMRPMHGLSAKMHKKWIQGPGRLVESRCIIEFWTHVYEWAPVFELGK